jgi:predicted phage-related endonuclease
MPDFSPEARKSAIWATDARKLAQGRQVQVYLEKTGQEIPEDIGHIEAVQWGLRLQEPIARAVGDRLNVQLKELDIEGTHINHPWMRSHFDFVSADGKTLYEIKNYNAGARSKFGDDGSSDVPAADLAQCLHEAAVYGVQDVRLCVLFGGQELCIFPIEADTASQEALILQEAALWAHIQRQQPPDSQVPEDLRKIFKQDNGSTLWANQELAIACQKLKTLKEQIKLAEAEQDRLEGQIQAAMGNASILAYDEQVLATWKAAKASMKFDSKRFQKEMPKVYEQYQSEVPGSRRFLIK